MKTITTIDLWTQVELQDPNFECFNGAFVDGIDEEIPFDLVKIYKNCNCEILVKDSIVDIQNKHNAIVFYKNENPVRLLLINYGIDVDKQLEIALNQNVCGQTLKDILSKNNIKIKTIDLQQMPIFNDSNNEKEIDVGSCDRQSLLSALLSGCYTESDTDYGKFGDKSYKFFEDMQINYILELDDIKFNISHHGAYINATNTRIIPLQINSSFISI